MDADEKAARDLVDAYDQFLPQLGIDVRHQRLVLLIAAALRRARQEEREACARVADDEAAKQPGGYGAVAIGIAAAIRARSGA